MASLLREGADEVQGVETPGAFDELRDDGRGHPFAVTHDLVARLLRQDAERVDAIQARTKLFQPAVDRLQQGILSGPEELPDQGAMAAGDGLEDRLIGIFAGLCHPGSFQELVRDTAEGGYDHDDAPGAPFHDLLDLTERCGRAD